jgi:hypothetical protein
MSPTSFENMVEKLRVSFQKEFLNQSNKYYQLKDSR